MINFDLNNINQEKKKPLMNVINLIFFFIFLILSNKLVHNLYFISARVIFFLVYLMGGVLNLVVRVNAEKAEKQKKKECISERCSF